MQGSTRPETDDEADSRISIAEAKRAKEAVKVENQTTNPHSPVQSRRLLREYSQKTVPHNGWESADATADPVRVDHESRRQVRMAPLSFDVERDNFPKVFTECGCGECPDVVDPLVRPQERPFTDVWRDEMGSLWAEDVCPEPIPVRLETAREAYLRFQKADHNKEERTSLCERTRVTHGKILGAERALLAEGYGTESTVILFSFRVSPIDVVDGERVWVTPVELDHDLHKSWDNVTSTLNYQLRDFEYEYVAITSTTTIAATPHTHMVVHVHDPDNDVTVDMARSVVNSHVENCPRAFADHHPVTEGESDAAILQHDPWIGTYPYRAGTADKIKDHQGEWTMPNTRAMEYATTQRPHWVIKNVYDGETNVHRDSVLVDGGAVAWARQHNWVKSSRGFDLQNGMYRGS